MKISTVLSASALVAMFSVVACSSPTTPISGSKSDADTSDEKDSDSKKDSKSSTSSSKTSSPTSPASNTTGTTGTPATTGTTDASEAACKTCLSAEPKYKAGMDCSAKCAKGDAACSDKCFKDAGCNFDSETDVCSKIEETCADKCEPPPPTNDELAACTQCMAANPQAAAINTCLNNAKSDDDANKCFDMQCDSACQNTEKSCESKCPE